MCSTLRSSFFTYTEIVTVVFLQSFATDLLHAIDPLLKLMSYFCFLEAIIIPANKHIFVASSI